MTNSTQLMTQKISITKKCTVPYSDLLNNLSDLWFKTHVKHAVSFIKHEISAMAKISFTGFQEIKQSTWSRNTDLCTCSTTKNNTTLSKTNFLMVLANTIDMITSKNNLKRKLNGKRFK